MLMEKLKRIRLIFAQDTAAPCPYMRHILFGLSIRNRTHSSAIQLMTFSVNYCEAFLRGVTENRWTPPMETLPI